MGVYNQFQLQKNLHAQNHQTAQIVHCQLSNRLHKDWKSFRKLFLQASHLVYPTSDLITFAYNKNAAQAQSHLRTNAITSYIKTSYMHC